MIMKTWQKLRKDPKLWQRYFVREKVIRVIRKFFLERNYHEVETPQLVPSVIPESYLESFTTTLLTRKREKKHLFLTASPEASLKKLVAAGIGNCFEITKSFRNGETHSNLHNPEFTILEWYQVGADYFDVMEECERLIVHIGHFLARLQASALQRRITYQGKEIDMTVPFQRISVIQALKKYADVDFDEITNKSAIKDENIFSKECIFPVTKKKGYSIEKDSTWEQLFNQIFLNEVEPALAKENKPFFVYDYPKPMAALAKIKGDDPRFAQRFELYIAGLELGDCYTELTDWHEQKIRFDEQLNEIKRLGETNIKPDLDFIAALKEGLPDCSGMAVGIDRLVMLFANCKTVQETLLFPLDELIDV